MAPTFANNGEVLPPAAPPHRPRLLVPGVASEDIERSAIQEEGRGPASRANGEQPRAAIEFIDSALLGASPKAAVYPVRGFAMKPGPVTLFLSSGYGGKSITLQDLLLSTSQGLKAWNRFQCERGTVVHMDFEQGRDETIDRYQRLARGRDLDPLLLADGSIKLAVFPRVSLFDATAEDDYKRAVDGAKLALVDTFAAASIGQDENDARIGQGVYMLGRVSEATGCIIIVAHHVSKATTQKDPRRPFDIRTAARGSGAIFAAAGYCYFLEGASREPKLVQLAKGRSLGDPLMEDFYLELAHVDVRERFAYFNAANPADPGGFRVTYRTGEQIHSPRAVESKSAKQRALMDKVLAYVREENIKGHGVSGKGAIKAAIEGRASDVDAAIETLFERGAVVDRPMKINGKGRERPRFWLPELARPEPIANEPAPSSATEETERHR